MRQKTWPITIKGDKWKYKLIAQKQYDKDYGPDSFAECMELKRIIVFSPKAVTLPIVRHELFHAYVSSLHLFSSNLDQTNFEEIIAELLEHKWEEMDEKAKLIYKNMKEHLDGTGKKVRSGKTPDQSNPKTSD